MNYVLNVAPINRYVRFIGWVNNKRAITGFILMGCALLYYQHKLLEKRCNDAGLNWHIDEVLLKTGLVLAASGLLLRPLGLSVLGIVVIQFVYGMYLRENWLPNLSGNPRPNNNLVFLLAGASCLVSMMLVLVSTMWLEAWFVQVHEGVKAFFWRLL